jgi:hypothetical protein
MKFARYWPLAAVVFGVGLTYVVFAQADSKAPPQQLPQPVDAVFETAEAPWSPSDLPQLGVIYSASKTETACSSGQCKLTAKPAAATCRDDCAASCNTQAACASGCAQVACESKCAVACDEACVSTCKTAKASVTAKTDCECGKNCACAKDCACGDKCQCRGDQAWKTAFAGACGVDCPCPVAGDYHGAAEWLPRPPHFLVTPYADPECGDYLARPSPSIKFWAPPPAAYHPGPVPFAPSYGPPPGFAPPPPPEMNRGMHEQVVRAGPAAGGADAAASLDEFVGQQHFSGRGEAAPPAAEGRPAGLGHLLRPARHRQDDAGPAAGDREPSAASSSSARSPAA